MLPKAWKSLCDKRAKTRQEQGLERDLRVVVRDKGGRLDYNERELINFASNDYLGLATHHSVSKAAAKTAEQFGTGSGASRLVSGTHKLHTETEKRIATHREAESCLLFTTGYQANLGVISTLADQDTLIVSDQLNHASMIDGARLSRARVAVYEHSNYAQASGLLRQDASRKLLVSDTLFSMSGDRADIKQLITIAKEHGALLMLDDAHGHGVFGEHGRGVIESQGHLDHEIGIVTGTLSKALGSVGGYACCSSELRALLLNHARSFMFSTAGSLPDMAAALAALDIIESEEGRELRTQLARLSAHLRNGISKLGLQSSGDSQIVPIYLDDPAKAVSASRQLEEMGFLVPMIRPPAAPWNRSMLRISLSATHSESDIDRLLEALSAVVA